MPTVSKKILHIDNEEYISTVDAGKASGYSNDHLSRLCRGGTLTCSQLGTAWFIKKFSLEAFLAERGRRLNLLSENRDDDISLTFDLNEDVVSTDIGDNFYLTLLPDVPNGNEEYLQTPKVEAEVVAKKTTTLNRPIPTTAIDAELMYAAMCDEEAQAITSDTQLGVFVLLRRPIALLFALMVAYGGYTVAQTYDSPAHPVIKNTVAALGEMQGDVIGSLVVNTEDLLNQSAAALSSFLISQEKADADTYVPHR